LKEEAECSFAALFHPWFHARDIFVVCTYRRSGT
jgi:hypothetical protein